MASPEDGTCRVDGCGGPASGICINKLSFDECPDVIRAGDEAADTDDMAGSSADGAAAPPQLSSPIGDSLDAQSCDALLRATGAKMIGIVAGPEAGKTTLVSTIYERVHRGMAKGFAFAGSETLRGYEERCHLSRLASNGASPDTERTKTWAELSFTHLKLAVGDERANLLFSDRSGEHFENVLDSPEQISDFEELARADHIWIVVDLDRLHHSGHLLKSQLRRLIMAMQAAGLLDAKPVSIVATKADLFTAKKARSAIEADLDAVIDDLQKRVPAGVVLGKHVIACRPVKGSTEFGADIDTLLGTLFEPEVIPVCSMIFPWPAKRSGLDKLMGRLRTAS